MDDQTDSVRRLSEWERPDLVALADEYGTPLYVMDLDRVRANYRRLSRAFKDVSVKYAAKANAGGHVLSTVVEAGALSSVARLGRSTGRSRPVATPAAHSTRP